MCPGLSRSLRVEAGGRLQWASVLTGKGEVLEFPFRALFGMGMKNSSITKDREDVRSVRWGEMFENEFQIAINRPLLYSLSGLIL
jgi:hypothetical protein